MPIDPQTIGTDTPTTEDGRSYPDHLRAYEAYDERLFPLLARSGEVTPTQFAGSVADRRLRTVVPRWMASAEWRGLIERTDHDLRSPRTYRVSDYGLEHFEP